MSIQLQEIQSIFISQNRLVEGLDESGTVEDTRLHQIYKNKLVEGKDYMIGEQLATTVVGASADGGGYIGAMLKLPDDYLQFSAELNLKNVSSNLILEHCVTFVASNNKMGGQAISRRYGNKHITYLTTGLSINILHDFGVIEGDMIIQVTQSEIIVNGVSAARVASPNAPLCFIGMSNRALKYSNIIKVTQDDSRILVPCKLLRPIPRNLDAQCKSRQTGECGMIDLISGRFYGNVANSGAFSLAWDEWLKDCSIQFDPETALGYDTSIPNDYVFYGRMEVAKLTAQYTDFGFMQASNNYIILGESTVYAISDWGTNKWATFVVSYSGGYNCSLQLNGVTLTTITQSTPYNQSPHIQLHGIMQLSKIEHTYYPDESDPTQSSSEVWKRFVEEDGRQGLGTSDLTYKIYAD